MDLLRPSYPAPHYPSAPITPLGPVGSPSRTDEARFADALTPGSVGQAAMGFLDRVAKGAKDPDHRFIASTALAALTKQTLPLSQRPEPGAQQAQYGIRVWNQAGTFLGKLTFDVRHGASGGYDVAAVSLKRPGSSPPVGFSLVSDDVLGKAAGNAGQPARSSGTKAHTYPQVGRSQRIEARLKLTQAIRRHNGADAEGVALW
jgi:hypothetical protein